jgi:hypothetical protein
MWEHICNTRLLSKVYAFIIKHKLKSSFEEINTKSLSIRLQVDLHLNITSNFSQIQSLSQKASWSRETAKQYPRHVSVFRGASRYARLAQPDALYELVHARPAPSYSLETSTDAFNVTQYGGIIYVSDVTALYEAPSSIK